MVRRLIAVANYVNAILGLPASANTLNIWIPQKFAKQDYALLFEVYVTRWLWNWCCVVARHYRHP